MRAVPNVCFVIEVCCRPGVDPVLSLRRALKYLRRSCGLRAVRVEQLPDEHSPEDRGA